MVVNELRGEKIDVVEWSEDSSKFVGKALAPASVKDVKIDEETKTALVTVPDYQLSLAIGKEGQNARLAARLTGWRIDIKSESQVAEERAAPRPSPEPEPETEPPAEATETEPPAEAAETEPPAEAAETEHAPEEAADETEAKEEEEDAEPAASDGAEASTVAKEAEATKAE
jgi:N utilization substance protein A